MSYLLKTPTAKKTPQSKPIPGRPDMVKNSAGGWVFKADSFDRMLRFLVLGSEGGSYYVGEKDLTEANVDNVRACIAQDGLRAVQMIVDISVGGRAPKNDPALYALALAASYAGTVDAERTRGAALAALPKVARIGTHLFQFCAFIDSMRGWGPALRKAVAAWYLEKDPAKLAYQLVKYQSRNGWSHSDVLRLTHPKADLKVDHAALFSYVRKGTMPDNQFVQGFELAKVASESDLISLIRAHGLTREMIPTDKQKSPKVWEALLEKMPLTAMIRTLGRMGSVGLLAPLSDASKHVVAQLSDREALKKARVHPIQLLSALLTYGQGHGTKGSLSWTTVPVVVDALNDAFYTAFDNVEPTGKRFYLGIDVSSSMTCGAVAGIAGLTPNMGAAAMAMLMARTEPNHFIGGFATSFIDLKVSKRDRLDAAMAKCQTGFGGTDCAIAMKHAIANKYPVDAFVVITDGMTWAGDTHSSQAIVDYRNKTGIDAKLICMNMVPTATRITDPTDLGSLDCVGFDASVPTIINSFLGANATVATEAD